MDIEHAPLVMEVEHPVSVQPVPAIEAPQVVPQKSHPLQGFPLLVASESAIASQIVQSQPPTQVFLLNNNFLKFKY